MVSRCMRILLIWSSSSRFSVSRSLARWCASSMMRRISSSIWRGDLFRVVGLLLELAPQERHRLVVTQRPRTELLAHAEAHDHLLGGGRRLLEVVGGAGGDLVEHDLLGGAAAERHGERVHELALGGEELVLGGQRDGEAQRLAAAHHGDLVHRVGVLEEVADEGVAHLVVGRDGLLLLGDDARLLLGTGEDAHDALFELVHLDDLLAVAGGQQRRLVDEVGEVGAGEARRLGGQRVEVDVLG